MAWERQEAGQVMGASTCPGGWHLFFPYVHLQVQGAGRKLL